MMTIYEIHVHLVTTCLPPLRSEEDALALMVLFHTHCIHLNDAVLDDRPGVTDIAAITQRHAADVVANAWAKRSDPKRTKYEYWYWQFQEMSPYEILEGIPAEFLSRMEELKGALSCSSLVRSFEPDD